MSFFDIVFISVRRELNREDGLGRLRGGGWGGLQGGYRMTPEDRIKLNVLCDFANERSLEDKMLLAN